MLSFESWFCWKNFKTCLPERIVVYLNEQKVDTLAKAAVLADDFVLTHRVAFPPARREHTPGAGGGKSPKVQSKNSLRTNSASPENRECFYCYESGHLITNCPVLQKKEYNQSVKKPKSVGFVQSAPPTPVSSDESDEVEIDECYKLFITKGSIS